MEQPVVSIEELAVSYATNRRRVDVLRGVSIRVESGERVAVMGRSWAGKSTLLHCIAGLVPPDAGRVVVNGLEVGILSDDARADFRLRSVGIVYQAFHLFEGMDALANVELPMRLADVPPKEARRRAEALLERVGLSDRARHRPSELSGGEQQRVAVARAVANEPVVVVADEPTGSLDDEAAAAVLDLLTSLDRTVIVATHDHSVAQRMDRTVRFDAGRLAPQVPDEVRPPPRFVV